MLAAAPRVAAAPASRAPAALVRADDRAVTFRVQVPSPSFSPSSLAGFERIHIDGFDLSGNPGEPPVPTRPFLVAIPTDATVSVTARVLSSEAPGAHRLEPVATPTMIDDDADDFGRVTSERIVQDDVVYRAWSAPAMVEADDPAYIRRTRVLPLRVNPVSYDPATGEVAVATSIEITVHISGGAGKSDAGIPAPPETKDWSEIFGRLLVNPAQGREWRAPRPAMALQTTGAASRMSIPGTVKISVRQTAMHSVTASALIAAGFPGGQPVGNLRLFKRGYDDASLSPTTEDIAFTVEENASGTPGVFDGNDLLIFYGRRLRDDASQGDTIETFSDHNVYWLEASPGTTMGSRTPGAGFVTSDTTTVSFPITLHQEEDHVFDERTPPGASDPYYYSFWYEAGPVDYPFDLNAVRPGSSVTLKVEMVGQTYDSPKTVKLSLVNSKGELVLNGAYAVPGVSVRTFTAPIADTNLDVGANRFRLNRVDNSRSALNVMPNWVEATYNSLFRARGNRLLFNTGTLTGDTTVTVTGLSTTTGLRLYDVTTPTAPVRMTLGAGNFPAASGGFALSFRETIPSRRTFVLTPLTNMVQVAAADLKLDTPSSIIGNSAESGIDVLVVSNALFVPQMRQWASYRRAQGYRVLVVDVEDVFDEFNGGVPSPKAIFRFTRHFFEHGDASALVLVGDASEDEKHVHSDSGPNFVPTYLRVGMDHVSTSPPDDEVVTTDKRFVKLPGPGGTIDSYPDLIVGRLPVGNTGELTNVLNKVYKYEAPTASDFWRKRMILVADDTYSTGASAFGQVNQFCNFPVEAGFQSSQEVTAQTMENALPAGYDIRRFYLKQYTDAFYTSNCASYSVAISFTRQNVTDLLMNELNQGATLVTIQAHMNRYTVTHERLLSTQSASILGEGSTGRDHLRVDNRGKPWILFAMGCHFSDYAIEREMESQTVSNNNPNGDSFAEQFLFQNDRGAVATYGSSGFEYLGPNADYLEDMTRIWFYEAPFDTMINQTQAEWKLGQLMFLTETQMVSRGQRDPVERYHILGDPLLRIDAGPPAFQVTVNGNSVRSGDAVESGGEGDTIQVVATVTDENAIRAFSLDIGGVDATDSLTVVPLVDTQIPRGRQYRVSFRHKLRSDNYDITLRAYQSPDTLAGKYHIAAEFVLKVVSSIAVSVNGRVVTSGSAVPATGSYRVDLKSPVFIPASAISVDIDGDPVPDITLTHPSAQDSLNWTITFQRTLTGGKHKLHVQAGTNSFTYDLLVSETAGLRNVINYPNPFRNEGTSFLYTNDVEIESGSLDIFTVSGKRVRSLPIPPGSRLPGENSVFWDGRDAAGERLANGVYLYVIRVSQRGGSATVRGKVSHIE